MTTLSTALAGAVLLAGSAAASPTDRPVTLLEPAPSSVRNVFVGGGGAVTYLAQSSVDPTRKYLVSDVAGLLRWDPDTRAWEHLHDAFGPDNVRGYHGELVAIHPEDPDVVLYSAGKEWLTGPNALYRSTDGGRTWSDPIVLSNADGRNIFVTNGGTGHRLVFDPHDGDVVFYGTRQDGLFRSDDAGVTWSRVENLIGTDDGRNAFVSFVQFDSSGGRDGEPTPVVYMGLSKADDAGADVDTGVYRSDDNGRTWQKIGGQHFNRTFGTVDARGNLYLHRGRVMRFDKADLDAGRWSETDLTPPLVRQINKNISAFAVSPFDADTLVCGTSSGSEPGGMFFSTDAGRTWRSYLNEKAGGVDAGGEAFDIATGQLQPYDPNFEWIFAVMHQVHFDRERENRIFFTGWYTIGGSDDIASDRPTFTQHFRGIEMVCLFDLISLPEGGPPLVSGMMDLGGFRHDDVDEMPRDYMNGIGQTGRRRDNAEDISSLDYCETQPDFLVKACGWKATDTGTAGYSTDAGASWQPFPTKPFADAKNGRIAVCPQDPDNVVWIPREPAGVYYTTDRGRTWQESTGAPQDMIYGQFVYTFYQPLAGDREQAGTFYLYDRRDGRFYVSTDAGASFEQTATLPAQTGIHYDRHWIRAAPGEAGRIYAGLDRQGLFTSSDAGRSWTRLTGVARAWSTGVGPGSEGDGHAVYILGRLSDDTIGDEQVAVYRSTDAGETWTRLTDPDVNGFGQGTVVTGCRQTPGRVYLGENGRGIFYIDPE